MRTLTISMLFVYILVILYHIWRSIHVIRRVGKKFDKKRVYLSYSIFFVIMCLTLILGGLLPECGFKTFCHKFSNYWLGIFIFLSFFVLIADIVVLILRLIYRKHKLSILDRPAEYRFLAIFVLGATILCSTFGFLHAQVLTQNDYDVKIEKDGGEIDSLKIVLIADLHIGYSIGIDYIQKVVDKINEQDADLVVIAGDIYDNEYDAIEDPSHMAEVFKSIKSKYGVYGVYGNHDVEATLIGGFTVTPNSEAYRNQKFVDFLHRAGVNMLEDEYVIINNSFYLVGREDLSLSGDGKNEHMDVNELMAKVDKKRPVIMVTHEPDELQETADTGVDLLLCGHTHAGQFFPLTIVQPLRYQNYWGYLKVGSMHNVVTSGIGVYGPNLRLFTDSEIAVINVSFGD